MGLGARQEAPAVVQESNANGLGWAVVTGQRNKVRLQTDSGDYKGQGAAPEWGVREKKRASKTRQRALA